jgi:hypothetical protein
MLSRIVRQTDTFLRALKDAGRVQGLPGLPLAEEAERRRQGVHQAWTEFEAALAPLRDQGGVCVGWDCRQETLDSLHGLVTVRCRLRELWPLPAPTPVPGMNAVVQARPVDWPPEVPLDLWRQARVEVSRLRKELADCCNRPSDEAAPAEAAAAPARYAVHAGAETAAAPPTGAKRESRAKRRGTVNQRMLEQLVREPASCQWTQREWGDFLHCKPSAVAATAAWQKVKAARALVEVDRLDRQKK